jgi:3-dehydroquinate dehydratase/shikimate dehydrogenase
VTLLCVPIMVRDIESALCDAEAARSGGADLVEYRLDEFFTGEGQHDIVMDGKDSPEVRPILHLIEESPLPCIATCRPTGPEGGLYDGDEDARIALFERLGTAFGRGRDGRTERAPRFLDVEFSTYTRSRNIRQKVNLAVAHPEQARDVETSLILSMHDFDGRPPDLSRRILAMSQESAARVLKIAFRARSIRDNLELFDLLERRDRPMIALGMGEHGLMARVLAPKFGGFLTFSSLRESEATAPGQPTLREMLDLYRFRSIDANTRIFGIVGDPVAQSLSPHVHNAGFAAIGANAVYLPMPVAGDRDRTGSTGAGYASLKGTLLELLDHPRLGLAGLSVTIPHKENLFRLAIEQEWGIDAASHAIGAANTLIAERNADGTLAAVRISNTDAPAIVESLMSLRGTLHVLRVAVLGSGGVARAAAFALSRAGCAVSIFARTLDRAASLARDLNSSNKNGVSITAHRTQDFAGAAFDVVINATPLGMFAGPDANASPLDDRAITSLNPHCILFDTVYNPIETPFLRIARERGFRTVPGVTMFVLQAEAQFRLFAGAPAPPGLFDRVARERLQSPKD